MNKVKANIARTIKENNINILEIDEYIDILSDKLRDIINETLDDYGLFMPEFFITAVMTTRISARADRVHGRAAFPFD